MSKIAKECQKSFDTFRHFSPIFRPLLRGSDEWLYLSPCVFYFSDATVISRLSLLATEPPDPRRVSEGFQNGVSEGVSEGFSKGFSRVLEGVSLKPL